MYKINSIDGWHIRIPLATPYRLSKVIGTQTHSDAVIIKITLEDGSVGWGECDPGGIAFTGNTGETVFPEVRQQSEQMIDHNVEDWVTQGHGRNNQGTSGAVFDVACHDALGRATNKPVWQFLGTRQRDRIPSLWPTSSGTAEEDLDIIQLRYGQGFRTYMLKMGDRPATEDLERLQQVLISIPDDVKIMVDANQGWNRQEARLFAEGAADLPLILIEQPVAADDHEGLHALRKTGCRISVDESMQQPQDAGAIIAADAADIFSIKISKNGGLTNCVEIAQEVHAAGKQVLMNSMLELGLTQAASLHLGCTLPNLVDCGHAYMSTLRMSDDFTDFSDWVVDGTAQLPDRPGLGVMVDEDKIRQYQEKHFHVS